MCYVMLFELWIGVVRAINDMNHRYRSTRHTINSSPTFLFSCPVDCDELTMILQQIDNTCETNYMYDFSVAIAGLAAGVARNLEKFWKAKDIRNKPSLCLTRQCYNQL